MQRRQGSERLNPLPRDGKKRTPLQYLFWGVGIPFLLLWPGSWLLRDNYSIRRRSHYTQLLSCLNVSQLKRQLQPLHCLISISFERLEIRLVERRIVPERSSA